ncbi:MAG: hypothetical protein JWR10_3615, partial [Rubritepida sp.]|nr:hypothetical protein [Rubritepida sp.]
TNRFVEGFDRSIVTDSPPACANGPNRGIERSIAPWRDVSVEVHWQHTNGRLRRSV